MKKLLFSIFSVAMLNSMTAQTPGDTLVVQAFDYSETHSTNPWGGQIRDKDLDFSVLPDDVTFSKIIMLYSMRCKDGLVSDFDDKNKGCGEWDYSANTYLHDPTKKDELLTTHPNYKIQGFSGDSYEYTDIPTYTHYQYTLGEAVITNTISETVGAVGTGTSSLNDVVSVQNKSGKSQFLITASELTSAGIAAGDITGLKLNVLTGTSEAKFLRIRFKEMSDNTIDVENLNLDGFTQVYFNNYTTEVGDNHLQFTNPFNWDGTSNILVELNFTSDSETSEITIEGGAASANTVLTSDITDHYMELGGTNQYLDLPDATHDFSDGMSFSAWVYYDTFGNWSRVIDFGNGPGSDNILIANEGTTQHLVFSTRNGSESKTIKAENVLVEKTWMYISGSVDASGNGKLYLNGEEVASGELIVPESIERTNNYIGKSNWNNDKNFDGRLDEVAMWNTALSLDEMKEHMYSKVTSSHSKYSNLLFSFSFDDANLTTASDDSANNVVGTVMNYVTFPVFKGDEIVKNISAKSTRPNIDFVQGEYEQTISETIELVSVQNEPNVVKNYEIIPDAEAQESDEVNEVSSVNYWEAVPEETIDGETGEVISTEDVTPKGTITIEDLEYYRRWDSRFEIMSFVTPYGIGLDLGEGKTWSFDVTDFAPVFKDTRRITVEGAGRWQEDMDIKFLFIVGTPPRDVVDIEQIWRAQSRGYDDIAADRYFAPKEMMMNADAEYFKIRSAITGHGQQGEFVPRNHYMNINGGSNEFTWQVWKECADNPIYPQGGTWVYDRAGWCPGMATDVEEMDITEFVTSGQTATIDYGVVSASGQTSYIVANQLVSYGEINHTLDAELVEVREPSNRVEFARFNSVCNDPKVVIKNTGATTLTSATIEYWVNNDGEKSTYEWTGSLEFNETAVVVLPTSDELWASAVSTTNTFFAEISAPNGGSDEYEFNNKYTSKFELPEVMPSNFTVYFKSNNRAYENNYRILDSDGNVVLERNNLNNNTIYEDDLELGLGCYTFEFNDTADDGIRWWANYQQAGIGEVKILQNGSTIKEFYGNGDFGSGFIYNFTVAFPLSYEEVNAISDLEVYPNPASDEFFITGEKVQEAEITIFDSLGRSIEIPMTVEDNKLTFNTRNTASGVYIINIKKGAGTEVKKMVIE
ncbi:LamG-like jellyroll fold domain-containing protein [Aureivirga sp. CE67]|uniref:LamG-like jellyroll fold domain-containing protein n=1 Tax=Aureivirga sp. CE67 TaxID=1788983 RepID=UPI0018CA1022|nr:LamG-like jellyroll fold domain-containing protein [Aureivirga sp. CE67]